MNNKEQYKKIMQLTAKCWADEAFKASFIKDPVKILKENGIVTPEGMKVRVVENTEKESYIVIPPKPSDELSEEQLDKVAGGKSGQTGCCCTGLCCCTGHGV